MGYYITSINFENIYHSLMLDKEYKSLDGICITDIFQFEGKDTYDIFSYKKQSANKL